MEQLEQLEVVDEGWEGEESWLIVDEEVQGEGATDRLIKRNDERSVGGLMRQDYIYK